VDGKTDDWVALLMLAERLKFNSDTLLSLLSDAAILHPRIFIGKQESCCVLVDPHMTERSQGQEAIGLTR
jgi:hypothetical protein